MSNITPNNSAWLPQDYVPLLQEVDWKSILNDADFFNVEELQMLRRLLDFGEPATPYELAERYGECPSFYTDMADQIGLDVGSIKNEQTMQWDTNNNGFWPNYGFWPNWLEGQLVERRPDYKPHIEFFCKDIYRWRLRDEVKQALQGVDLSHIELYAKPDTDEARLERLCSQDLQKQMLEEQKRLIEEKERKRLEAEKKKIDHLLELVRYGVAMGGILLAALQIWLSR